MTKKCSFNNCNKYARSKSEYCSKHGGGKRCKEPECPSGAIGSTKYCSKHGGGKSLNVHQVLKVQQIFVKPIFKM